MIDTTISIVEIIKGGIVGQDHQGGTGRDQEIKIIKIMRETITTTIITIEEGQIGTMKKRRGEASQGAIIDQP
jgi:hypothetical protein